MMHKRQKMIIYANSILIGIVSFCLLTLFVVIVKTKELVAYDCFICLLIAFCFSCFDSFLYMFYAIYPFVKSCNMRYVMPYEIETHCPSNEEFAKIFANILTKQGYEARVKHFNRKANIKCEDDSFIEVLDSNRKSVMRIKCFKDKIDRDYVCYFADAMHILRYTGLCVIVSATSDVFKEDIDCIKEVGMSYWSKDRLKVEIDKAFGL